jgi:magnesium transporter
MHNNRVHPSGRVSRKRGLPPGSLVHVGTDHQQPARITLVDYSPAGYSSRVVDTIDDILPFRYTPSLTWVNIGGLSDIALMEAIGEHFGIHRLVLEDILNTHQRPKCEEHDKYIYLVLRSISQAVGGEVTSADPYEQVSIVLLDNFVFTFEEQPGENFEPIRRRIQSSLGRFCGLGTDYLVYVILDTLVDQYFDFEEAMAERIDAVEEILLHNPTAETLAGIQRLKRDLIKVRRAVTPLRELLNGVLRANTALVNPATHIYFRDVYDHCLRITETLDTYRDMVTGLLDIYISSVSQKLNEIMKVLTVFASIFIPLTFITGIYGMNFDVMPELHWPWAYPLLWVGFICIPVILLTYFKRKRWL